RLLEEDVLARGEGGDADLCVEVVGDGDHDGVDVLAGGEMLVADEDWHGGKIAACHGGRGLPRAGGCGELGGRGLGDGVCVVAAPEAIADQAEVHALPPSPCPLPPSGGEDQRCFNL